MRPVTAADLFATLGDLDAFGEKILSVKTEEGEYIAKYVPHDGQKRLIEARNNIVLVTAGNAAGKTMGLTIDHIYCSIFKIGLEHLIGENMDKWLSTEYKTLNCSFEYKTAKIVFDNIVKLHETNPLFRNVLISRISQTENRIYWFNGAQTHCYSLDEGGKHTEGNRYRLVTVDEIGWTPNLQTTYYTVLMPRTLGVNGITKLAGTPKEIQDTWIDELYQKANDKDENGNKKHKDIEYIRMPTSENPYLPPEQLVMLEEATKDFPVWHRMVFHGELVQGSGKVLTASQIANAIDESLPFDPRGRDGKPTKGTPIMFGTQPRLEGHKYVTFWDMAMKMDWAVGITLDATALPFRLVNYTRVNKTNIKGWSELTWLMHREHERYGSTQNYDATGQIGGKLEEDFKTYASNNNLPLNWSRPMSILGDKGRMKTNQIGKEELINCLTLAFAWKEPVDDDSTAVWGRVRMPNIHQLVKELRGYHIDDKKLKETDSVIALAGALAKAPNPEKKFKSGFLDKNPMSRKSYIRNPAYA